MDHHLSLLVSDECDKLLSELRSISHNSSLSEIQDELLFIKNNIYDSIEISKILSPFEKIIKDNQTTDVITSLALSSINAFIIFSLFESDEDVQIICNTLINCQFQSTSDYDCLFVNYRIITCIISLAKTDFLDSQTISLLFEYIVTEIKNGNQTLPPLLMDALCSISIYPFSKKIDDSFVQEKILSNLFFFCIAEKQQVYMRQCGLISFLEISRIQINDLVVSYACALFNRGLKSFFNKDHFVLVLRIFTNVFIENYMEYHIPFSKCFSNLLNFIESPLTSLPLKKTASEILTDFISQSNFLINLFINFNNVHLMPSIFDKLISALFMINSNKLIFSKIFSPVIDNHSKEYFYFNNNDVLKKEELIKLMNEFVQAFNQKPFSFLTVNDPQLLAKCLFDTSGLSRKQIGEFFGKNNQFCIETLKNYLSLLDFSKLDFDTSIRLFLSGFQISGEGQIIDRILECFSHRFFECSNEKNHFANAESVHILSYGWLMLHTSFHNNNVTNKPTFDSFLQMMENQNGGQNFSKYFLKQLFESIKNVCVPFEDSEQEGNNAYWQLQIFKQRSMKNNFNDLFKMYFNVMNSNNKDENIGPDNKEVFPLQTSNESQNNIQNASKMFSVEKEMLRKIFKSNQEKIIDMSISNVCLFNSICANASKYGLNDIIDNIIEKLTKNAIDELLKSQETITITLIDLIITKFGTSIRNKGWISFISFLMSLFDLDLLNDEILSFKNIANDMKSTVFCHRLVNSHKKRNSVFSLFLGKRTSSDDNNRSLNKSSLKDFVTKQKFEKFIEISSEAYSNESIMSLISAIDTISQEVVVNVENDQMRLSFFSILMEKIITANKLRILKASELYENNWKSKSINKRSLSSEYIYPINSNPLNTRSISSFTITNKFPLDYPVEYLSLDHCFLKINNFFSRLLSIPNTTFLPVIALNEAFLLIYQLWDVEGFRIYLLELLNTLSEAPNINHQIDLIEKWISIFLKSYSESFLQMNKFKGMLKLLQIGIISDSPKSSEIFLQISSIDDIIDKNFDDVRYPMIQIYTTIILLHNMQKNSRNNLENEIMNITKFSDMKSLILNENTSANQWQLLFNDVFFPLTTKKIQIENLLTLILDTFAFCAAKLQTLPLFESIWFRILSITLEFGQKCDPKAKEPIEKKLKGCLNEMMKKNIFNSTQTKLWNLTKSNIEKVFPELL